MIRRLGVLNGICLIALIGGRSDPAFAGSSTATLTITSSVVANCTAITPNPGSIAFSNYDPFTYGSGQTLVDSTPATFSANCTQGDTLSWTVGIGNNCSKGSLSNYRAMTDGASHYLSYQLWQNSSDTTQWAFGSSCGAPTAVTQTATGTTANTISVYGTIPGGQNVNTGNYSDAVTVTVSF
jgi:spore coat protein U-like protein